MKNLAFLFIFFLLIGCKQEKKSAELSDNTADPSSFEQTIKVSENKVQLVPEAREQAVQWLAYITAQNEVESLKDASVHQVMESSKPLVQIMESLQNTLPDTLKSTPVEARINVLVTKAHILEQLSTQRKPNPDKIAEVAKDIPQEFNNFKLQLNELFLKSIEDFEKEMDKMEEEEKNSKSKKGEGDSLGHLMNLVLFKVVP